MKRWIAGVVIAVACAHAHACDWRCTAEWFNSDPHTRVSAEGPDLSAYGGEGNGGMEAVSRCTSDVARMLAGMPAYNRALKQCYQLYPASVRARMYKVDNAPSASPRVDVYIHHVYGDKPHRPVTVCLEGETC